MTLAQIATGLNALLMAHPQWAPSLGEFRQLCKPRVEPAHQKYLPPPRQTVDISAHVATIKESLGETSDWWRHANSQTVELLQRSNDPNAQSILNKISAHNPTLYAKRKERGWVGE